MDEWYQSPSEQPTPEQPVTPPPAEPVAQPTEPSEVPQAPQTPYDPYGWNTAPSYTPSAEPPKAEPEPSPTPTSYGWVPPSPPQKPKRNGTKVALAVVSGLCAVIIIALSGAVVLLYRNGGRLFPETNGAENPSTNVQAPTLQITELDEEAEGLSTTEIVDRNINSAVLLTMYQNTTSGGFPFGQTTDQMEPAGFASGIVMSADGYIITNWHCVVNETTDTEFPRIDVKTYDGTVYENAEIIGHDSSTDLAVIKVDATDLKPAEFGDSTQLKMGNKVVALGNSGGLGWSTTQGIVSGLARDVYEDTGYAIKCLQIDAAINPGNSGGPLFNAAGQVIAVNSAKIVASGYEGIGFAIPINEAKVIIDNILANGYVTGRVALGITGQTYTDSYYEGFLIYTIEDYSPLKNTEVKRGDLIVKINDTEVSDYADLRSALAKHKVGDTVTLTLLRSANREVKEFTVSVQLTEERR
ncbi:MAG: trypsin-like peptidase domain-containing protein [Clostridia bacterium]|nr:trypsin-like peptidase domain-containing protein [Clostridia bacterium]